MESRIPLEKTIVEQIMRRLKVMKLPFVIKTHGGPFQAAGIPDIVLIARNGRFVGLEVKRPCFGVVSELQKAMLRRINRAGGYGCVVYSPEDAALALDRANIGLQAPEII